MRGHHRMGKGIQTPIHAMLVPQYRFDTLPCQAPYPLLLLGPSWCRLPSEGTGQVHFGPRAHNTAPTFHPPSHWVKEVGPSAHPPLCRRQPLCWSSGLCAGLCLLHLAPWKAATQAKMPRHNALVMPANDHWLAWSPQRSAGPLAMDGDSL
jgi:hypothetical protein